MHLAQKLSHLLRLICSSSLTLPPALYMYMTIIFEHLFLLDLLANQNQIKCGA